MSNPYWPKHTLLPSRSSSVDEAPEDEECFLIKKDLESAQEKRLLSIDSSLSDFGSECDATNTGYAMKIRYRTYRIGHTLRHVSRRNLLVSIVVSTILFLSFGLSTTSHLRRELNSHGASVLDQSRQSVDAHSSEHTRHGVWPDVLGVGGTTKLCDICDCETQPGFYAPKPEASKYEPRPQKSAVDPEEGTFDRNAYMRQSLLDIYCARQHMSTSQTSRLVRRTASHINEMMAWNVTGLDFNKSTIYLTTNTSPNGKANELRPQYFRRHARTVLDWQNPQLHPSNATNATNNTDWQVLWVIVEDELDVDPEVVRTLRRTGAQFVYFAYGPTNVLGHAQRNAAMQLIYTLTQTFRRGGVFGHGPVYCIDDDNKMATDLLGLLTQINRIGVFPVGNFGVKGGYEKPLISPIGEVMGSNSPWRQRKYPFDNAGFAFNSSLLGNEISGPTFWKWSKYGGESEFIEQIVNDLRQLEPLCGRDKKQDCRVAWHNEPLVGLEALTDDDEIAYIKRFGWETFRARLDAQLKARVEKRGF